MKVIHHHYFCCFNEIKKYKESYIFISLCIRKICCRAILLIFPQIRGKIMHFGLVITHWLQRGFPGLIHETNGKTFSLPPLITPQNLRSLRLILLEKCPRFDFYREQRTKFPVLGGSAPIARPPWV